MNYKDLILHSDMYEPLTTKHTHLLFAYPFLKSKNGGRRMKKKNREKMGLVNFHNPNKKA